MKRIVCLAFLAALAPGAALAAPTLVRTGEHEGFTRLVVDFADRPDWSIVREDGALVLKTGRAVGYDLSRAFRRIRRDRLADLSEIGEGDLRLDLNCACDVRTIELPNQGLVIDIRDGDGAPRVLPDLVTEAGDLIVAPGLLRDIERGDAGALLRRDRLAEVRESVENGVDRGVAQGLTRPSDAALRRPAEIRLDPEPGKPDLSAFDNIRVGTQIDRDRASLDTRGTDCPAPERFAVEQWGEAGTGLGALAPLRAKLYSTDDGLDPAAARELARGLLYFTFGLEAADVLKLDPAPSEERDALLGIAAIMDGGSVSEEIYPFATCGGGASMWAILGGMVLPDQVVQSALAAFDRMPPHLRSHLGPRLVRRLLAQDRPEEARLVERAIERSGDTPDGDAVLADAEMSQHDGREAEARDALEDLATSGLPQAGTAMAELLTSLGTGGEAASNALIDQAMALSFELDGDLGARLDAEIVLALGRNQRFDEAMSYLGARDIDVEKRAALRDDIYAMVLEAEDAVFVATAARLLDGPRPGDDAALAIAARLTDHGLVPQAREYLDTIAGPPNRDERLIRARLAAITGDAEAAASYLAGLDGAGMEQGRDDARPVPQEPAPVDVPSAEPAVEAAPVVPAAALPPAVAMPSAGEPNLLERSRALLSESEDLREALSAR